MRERDTSLILHAGETRGNRSIYISAGSWKVCEALSACTYTLGLINISRRMDGLMQQVNSNVRCKSVFFFFQFKWLNRKRRYLLDEL